MTIAARATPPDSAAPGHVILERFGRTIGAVSILIYGSGLTSTGLHDAIARAIVDAVNGMEAK